MIFLKFLVVNRVIHSRACLSWISPYAGLGIFTLFLSNQPVSYTHLAEALSEIEEIKTFFAKFGAQLPPELESQRQEFGKRAEKAPEVWTVEAA